MNSDNLRSVVCIGGGTGLSCLLKGLKHGVYDPPIIEAPPRLPWIARLTAVVTVTDDGGSSGRLREELQVLPPGDIRNCLVALSADESLLSHLFQYRFKGRGHLKGHSFGNLFLTALTGVTGDFLEAIRVSSDVLAVKGRIYPSTIHDVRLEAFLEDGSRVQGESAISKSTSPIAKLELNPARCRPIPAVIDAIKNADVITVGPGSLFTSLLPNLLVPGISEAILRSKAVRIFICNLMTQPGETSGYTAADHLNAIQEHTGARLFDWAILNSKPVSGSVLERYRSGGATPVANDIHRIRSMGLEIYEHRLAARGKVIRHDSDQLAEAVQNVHQMRGRTGMIAAK